MTSKCLNALSLISYQYLELIEMCLLPFNSSALFVSSECTLFVDERRQTEPMSNRLCSPGTKCTHRSNDSMSLETVRLLSAPPLNIIQQHGLYVS